MKRLTKTILLISTAFIALLVLALAFLYSVTKENETYASQPQYICGNALEPKPESTENGRNLFLANCAACHKLYKRATGPALSEIHNRIDLPSENYFQNFVINEDSLVGKELERAKVISNQYQSNFQHRFKLSETEIQDLLEYLN